MLVSPMKQLLQTLQIVLHQNALQLQKLVPYPKILGAVSKKTVICQATLLTSSPHKKRIKQQFEIQKKIIDKEAYPKKE